MTLVTMPFLVFSWFTKSGEFNEIHFGKTVLHCHEKRFIAEMKSRKRLKQDVKFLQNNRVNLFLENNVTQIKRATRNRLIWSNSH